MRHGLGESLGAGYKEAREACGEQRLYQSSLSAQSHLPQGFPTHREKHNQGPECSWALLRGGWSSKQEVQVARRSYLPSSISWWQAGKVPYLPDTLLLCNSLLYSASENNNKNKFKCL